MSPAPTEQLIRDYLNRLSVAARDRLGPEERRALVDRTRKVIERRADFAGRPTTLEVGKVLARLGDPAVLVDQEWRRLAAVRGDRPGGPPEQAGPPELADSADSWELAEPAEPGSSRGFLAWAFRRDKGRSWRASGGWPAAVASENGDSHDSPETAGSTSVQPQWPPPVARENGIVPYPQSGLPARTGTIAGAGIISADPATAAAGDGPAPAANGTSGINGTSITSGSASDPEADEQFGEPARPAVLGGAVRLLGRMASAAWQHPLETTAIILLGLGGVIFPPVFLLGALVALGSRSWHYRDKWAGLVLPPLLTIIAAAAAIAVGGRSHGLHDAWVALNVVSRVAALLGAGYLAWRTGPGHRPPPAPPWHKPNREPRRAT